MTKEYSKAIMTKSRFDIINILERKPPKIEMLMKSNVIYVPAYVAKK